MGSLKYLRKFYCIFNATRNCSAPLLNDIDFIFSPAHMYYGYCVRQLQQERAIHCDRLWFCFMCFQFKHIFFNLGATYLCPTIGNIVAIYLPDSILL